MIAIPIDIGHSRSPPPIPKRSSKVKNTKQPTRIPSAKAKTFIKTYRFSADYMDVLLPSPANPQENAANVENPFSDAFAARVSEDTEQSRYGSVFDARSHEAPTPDSVVTGPVHENRVSLLENIPDNAEVASFGLPSLCRDHESCPSFTSPLERQNIEPSPEQVQKPTQGLVGKVGGLFKKLQELGENLEAWTSEQERKSPVKKREPEKRRASLARAKATGDQIRAQIKEHQERERARNKRAKEQLKLQTKYMKQSAKRRNLVAKGKRTPSEDDGRLVRFWDCLRYGRPIPSHAEQAVSKTNQEGAVIHEGITSGTEGYERVDDTSSSNKEGEHYNGEGPEFRTEREKPTRAPEQEEWENWDEGYTFPSRGTRI